MATQHLRLVGRQVELAPSHIDPHVVVGRHQIGVARESETDNVEQRRKALIRNGDVDVLEVNGISEIFGGAIECLLHDQRVLKLLCPKVSWGHNSTHPATRPRLGWHAKCAAGSWCEIAMQPRKGIADGGLPANGQTQRHVAGSPASEVARARLCSWEGAKPLILSAYCWLTKIIPPASYCGHRFLQVPIHHEYQCCAKDYGGWRCWRLRPDAGWSALLLWQLGSGWFSCRQRRRREDRRHVTQAAGRLS